MRVLPQVQVIVAPETLARITGGTITGQIWLHDGVLGEQADFPEQGWSDLPLAVLANWVPELQKLARTVPSTGVEVDCFFMDGPYHFVVRVEQPGAWTIRCIEERTRGSHSLGPEWRTEPGFFLNSLADAGRAVLAHCDARGWWSDDTERLRRALEP